MTCATGWGLAVFFAAGWVGTAVWARAKLGRRDRGGQTR